MPSVRPVEGCDVFQHVLPEEVPRDDGGAPTVKGAVDQAAGGDGGEGGGHLQGEEVQDMT